MRVGRRDGWMFRGQTLGGRNMSMSRRSGFLIVCDIDAVVAVVCEGAERMRERERGRDGLMAAVAPLQPQRVEEGGFPVELASSYSAQSSQQGYPDCAHSLGTRPFRKVSILLIPDPADFGLIF